MRKERVLLGPVEAVDLVDEEHGSQPIPVPPPPCTLDDLANVADTGQHRAEMLLGVPREQRQKPGKARLSRSRRTPEDQRGETPARVELAQGRTGSGEVLLSQDLIPTPRSHPVRKRCRGARSSRVIGAAALRFFKEPLGIIPERVLPHIPSGASPSTSTRSRRSPQEKPDGASNPRRLGRARAMPPDAPDRPAFEPLVPTEPDSRHPLDGLDHLENRKPGRIPRFKISRSTSPSFWSARR